MEELGKIEIRVMDQIVSESTDSSNLQPIESKAENPRYDEEYLNAL